MRAVNLLPREYAKARRQGPPPVTQALVALPVLVAVLVGAIWHFYGSGLPGKRTELQQLRDKLASMPLPQQNVQRNPVLTAQKAQRVTALATALQGRVAWDRVLRHISSVLPGDVWLTKLTASAPVATVAPPPPPPTTTATTSTTTTSSTDTTAVQPPAPVATPAVPSPIPVEIDGYTYSHDAVARFLARLALVPDLTDVELKSSALSTIGTRNVVQFSITATVPPGGGSS
jgi:Tfp pilus assembly protein PilN